MIRKIICLFLLFSLFFNLKILILYANTVTIAGDPVTVSATVEGGGTVTTTPLGGGGGGMPQTSVRFSGQAYPYATVTLLKNGTVVTSVTADKNGLFSITLAEKYDGTILYSLVALDPNNKKSLLINYPLVVTAGYLTDLSGVVFPPTVVLDKVQVALGDYLTVSGYALPQKDMEIVIQSQDKKISKTYSLTSPSSGLYDITLPLMNLPVGNYSVYVQYRDDTRISELIRFIIGDTNISSLDNTLNIPGDCNYDGKIDLVDFSVLAFWFEKPHPPSCVDVNHDGIVDLTDFSILAFYWTN